MCPRDHAIIVFSYVGGYVKQLSIGEEPEALSTEQWNRSGMTRTEIREKARKIEGWCSIVSDTGATQGGKPRLCQAHEVAWSAINDPATLWWIIDHLKIETNLPKPEHGAAQGDGDAADKIRKAVTPNQLWAGAEARWKEIYAERVEHERTCAFRR